ncbi:hypothetical protein [Actinotalea subterranea]|uniref:hypothetical protein n=1 Tax=Actinotalea subterranea TaxID=2607497 RepID=UPI0011EF3417|nr:hypothetical protein [Actinotalea subterranea]
MLAAAVLVPETALLVPGAAGTADVLRDERSAAVAAVRDGLRSGRPDRVVLVGPRGRPRTMDPVGLDQVRPTLAAAGIPDDAWASGAWAVPGEARGPVLADVALAVAALVLRAAGWTGAVSWTGTDDDGVALRALGASLADGADRVMLLLVGSLSARRGPDAPLAEDPRAVAVDAALLDDLARLGWPTGPGATSSPGAVAVPRALAAELAITAWGPCEVLRGAAEVAAGGGPDEAVTAQVRLVGAPLGATYAVVLWAPR